MASQEDRLRRKAEKMEAEILARETGTDGVAPEVVVIEPEPATAEPVAAAPVATEPPAPAGTDSFEQQFKTAQGRLEQRGKELKEARDETARTRALVEEQMRTIDTLVMRQAEKPPVTEPPAPVAPAPTAPSAVALTDSENDVLAAYEGLEPIFRKLARQEAAEVGRIIAEQLRNEFAGLVTPVRTEVETIRLTAKQQKAARFQDDTNALLNKGLAQGTHNCVEIHGSPEFKEWIMDMVDFDGNPYIERYNQAVLESYDANIAARIQKEFLRDCPAPAPDPVPASAISSAPATVAAAAPVVSAAPLIPAGLEDQIAPSRAVGGEAPTGPRIASGVVPTLAEVAKLGTKRAVSPTPENEKAYVDALQAYNEAEVRKKTAAGKR